MRKWSLILCALCCAAGLWMTAHKSGKDAVQTLSPKVVQPSLQPACIVVEEANVRTLQPAPQPVTLLVYGEDGLVSVDMEEYLVYVLAGEMPASYEPEALKAQAVAARSYIAWKMPRFGGGGCSRAEDADVCTDSAHCMAYLSEEEMRADWGGRCEEYRKKIGQAVKETAGEVMLYAGEPVQALFHASSAGWTEDAQAVWGTALPYLTSVSSAEEDTEKTKRYSAQQLAGTLNAAFDGAGLTAESVKTQFAVRSRTESGRADTVRVGKVTATGRAVRSALGLNSTNFVIGWEGNEAVITTEGYGHGVGMSQVGANVMAQEGQDYRQILTHYYTGVEIGSLLQ